GSARESFIRMNQCRPTKSNPIPSDLAVFGQQADSARTKTSPNFALGSSLARVSGVVHSIESLTKLNPRLIYVSHKGFLPGPYEHRTQASPGVGEAPGRGWMHHEFAPVAVLGEIAA